MKFNYSDWNTINKHLVVMSEIYTYLSAIDVTLGFDPKEQCIQQIQTYANKRRMHFAPDVWPLNQWPTMDLGWGDLYTKTKTYLEEINASGMGELLTMVKEVMTIDDELECLLPQYHEGELLKLKLGRFDSHRRVQTLSPYVGEANILRLKVQIDAKTAKLDLLKNKITEIIESKN